jgi:phosphosulfolactate synthase
MKAFNQFSIPLPNRSLVKPRQQGITMMMDDGLGLLQTKDLCETAGDYIDFVKLGYGTARLYGSNLLEKKIAAYREHDIDVMPGGTFFEIAVTQHAVERYFRAAKTYGFSAIEVSDGTITLSDEARVQAIRRAQGYGFRVLSEVGKKAADKDMSATEWIRGIRRDLQADVCKVILEARGSGTLGIYDNAGLVREEKVRAIVDAIPVDNLVFEAPLKKQQVFFIRKYGLNVNLGNIRPNDVVPCEALRQGLRSDTFRTVV